MDTVPKCGWSIDRGFVTSFMASVYIEASVLQLRCCTQSTNILTSVFHYFDTDSLTGDGDSKAWGRTQAQNRRPSPRIRLPWQGGRHREQKEEGSHGKGGADKYLAVAGDRVRDILLEDRHLDVRDRKECGK